MEEKKGKSVLKSRKLWYSIGTAVTAFVTAYWGVTHPEYVALVEKLILVIGGVGVAMIGGHSWVDAVRERAKAALGGG